MGRHNPEHRHRSKNQHRKHRSRPAGPLDTGDAADHGGGTDSPRRSRHRNSLSADAIAQLNREGGKRKDRDRDRKPKAYRDETSRPREDRHKRHNREDGARRKVKARVVSGSQMEEGRGPRLRGGGGGDDLEKDVLMGRPRKHRKRRKRLWIMAAVGGLILIIIIIVAAVVASQKKSASSGSDAPASAGPSKSNLDGKDPSSVPAEMKNTYLDPWSWYDTSGFNVTFTSETVGDLPIIGLLASWDDSAAANERVPALNEAWGSYADRPARGVNVGGWLSLEPFITPSLFNYPSELGIVDEWTLCQHLGPGPAARTLETHYATFVTETTFKEIKDAGLDHVRIPFSYWAVEVYDDDPYIFRTSWRYLLRGIEWARKYGLRVSLDLHGLPGSQNGWNHSGRLGAIGWLNGPNGTQNAQRSIDVHDRLSKFFAQDRYRNIISYYGLANEPRMVDLQPSSVISWTEQVYGVIRGNGLSAILVFGDGFMGLERWQGQMGGYENLALDVHQYVIFNSDQITMKRHDKVKYACDGWSQQSEQSMDTSTGFGPTIFAEWSQADSDCARHLTNVGWGNRWTGTYNSGDESSSALEPRCPTLDDRCSCGGEAGASTGDANGWRSGYKQFLRMFAEAQMHSFEKGWGWWYWTWDTENAPLWSYKKGMAAGILPQKAYDRDFDCSSDIPGWEDVNEYN